jgi:hypothetical protein
MERYKLMKWQLERALIATCTFWFMLIFSWKFALGFLLCAWVTWLDFNRHCKRGTFDKKVDVHIFDDGGYGGNCITCGKTNTQHDITLETN